MKRLLLVLFAATACVDQAPNPYANRSVVTPLEVAGGREWSAVATGLFHSCGLTLDGSAFCWGSNRSQQLGVTTSSATCGGDACAREPVPVMGGHSFTRIAAYGDRSCGLTSQGAIYCWGTVGYTADGYGNIPHSADPVVVVADSPFVAISAGGCALAGSGMAFCWGENADGKLGDGTLASRAEARPVSTTERFKSISTAAMHSCAVSLTGVAFCWGRNIWGQLGLGEVPYQNTGAPAVTIPTAVATIVRFSAIGAGGIEFTCALAENGRAYCWGRDDNASELGDRNPGSARGTPGLVADDHAFVAISVGDIATCGLTSTGASYCWGDNYFGTLTDPAVVVGGGIDYPVPTRGSPYLSVSVGGSHACGIRPDHHLFCWGDSYYGQVGAR